MAKRMPYHDVMLNDIRFGLRTLRQNPGFALTAIISIALAIGANSAIFSLADGLVFRPLPVPDASQVVSVRSRTATATPTAFGSSGTFVNVSFPDFLDFRGQNRSFSGLLAYRVVQVGFSADPKNQPRLEGGLLVSGNFFSLLGIEPKIGRGFRPDEDEVPGRDAVIVLQHDFWNREFGEDPSVLGRRIRLNSLNFTIIGVAPESFTGMDHISRPAFFIPAMMGPKLHANYEDLFTNRNRRTFWVKG